jgi:Major Facilitator Superfamily
MAVSTRLWSARRLLLTMSSQSASTFANQVVAFVIPWLVLSRTGSALNAGGVAFATGIASVVGTLFGGVIVDRIGGRRTAIISDALSLVTVLALVVALVADFVPIWLIVVTQVLGVLFDGPGMVARDALVPTVARQDDVPLVRATSLQETLQNTAMFVGPLAAGLLISAVAEQGTLLVAAVMFAAAMLLIAGLERQRPVHDQPLTPARALADVREGFRFIVTEPLLGPLTWLLVAWVAVYVPLSTLIFPAWFNFARESAGALGLFLGAQALGGVLGGLIFAAVGPRVSRFWWFVDTEVVATAVLAALLATEPGSVAAVVLSFGIGLIAAGSLPIINTAYYSRTPEELLGRVNGTSFAMVLTVLPFSSLAFGWLINATSPETAITVVVVAANTVMVAAFALVPAMRLVDAPGPEQP